MPRGERLPNVLRVVLHRQQEHLCLRSLLEDERDALDARLARHDDVHQHDVGLRRSRLEDCLPHIAGLAHDVDVLLLLEQEAKAGTNDSVVVHDEDADLRCRFAHGTGTSATIVVPTFSSDSTRRRPSISPSRSRMPTRPMLSSRLDAGSKPRPSSAIRAVTSPARWVTETSTVAAPACLTTFVSASWTMR